MKFQKKGGTFSIMSYTGFKYMLKRIRTKSTVCTSWDTAKTINFVVVFACWQNFMQIFEDKFFIRFLNFSIIFPN